MRGKVWSILKTIVCKDTRRVEKMQCEIECRTFNGVVKGRLEKHRWSMRANNDKWKRVKSNSLVIIADPGFEKVVQMQ